MSASLLCSKQQMCNKRLSHFVLPTLRLKWGGCLTSGSRPSDVYIVQCGVNTKTWTESSYIKSLEKHVCHSVFHVLIDKAICHSVFHFLIDKDICVENTMVDVLVK